MRSTRPAARILLRSLLFMAAVGGIVLAASSIRLGTPVAASSQSSISSPITRRAFLPMVLNRWDSTNGVYLGIWLRGLPEDTSVLTSFQNTVGTKMAFVMWYQGWAPGEFFDQAAAQWIFDQGSMPLLTWEPWTPTPDNFDADIAAGRYDSFIRTYAQGVKSYGKPVFLRLAHEMNGTYYQYSVGINGNTAQDYVNAWRRVHNIFTNEGATNVIWVWSPKVGGTVPLDQIQAIYPGDDYVDWMGLDGYNGGTALSWGGWLWFSDVFGAYYRTLTQLSQKPIMIAEAGSVEQGGSKAAWITDAMLTQLPQNFPRIKALIWFNENWYDETGRNADWRIESSPSSVAAFSQAAANPYFKSSFD